MPGIFTTRLGEMESEDEIEDYVPRGTRKLGAKHQNRGGTADRTQMSASNNEDESLAEWVARAKGGQRPF